MENNKIATTAIPGKDIALISYITIIGLIIAFVMNTEKKHEFAQFHIRQSLGLFLTAIILSFISMIPFLGWIVWIVGIFALLFMWIKGLINAANGKQEFLPFLGQKYAEIFKNL